MTERLPQFRYYSDLPSHLDCLDQLKSKVLLLRIRAAQTKAVVRHLGAEWPPAPAKS